MKSVSATLTFTLFTALAVAAYADKPADKGMDKAQPQTGRHELTAEEREHFRQLKEERERDHKPMQEESGKEHKKQMQEREHNMDHSAPGLDKQTQMKADQERKEAGKGSEQGQQMRAEKSKKWWKFWD